MLTVEENYGVMSRKVEGGPVHEATILPSSHFLNTESRSQWKIIETAIESSVKKPALLLRRGSFANAFYP
jgi:hypothetical protein